MSATPPCGDRRTANETTIHLVTTMLAALPEARSQGRLFIFTTNLPDVLDPALQSRCGVRKHFTPPTPAIRAQILRAFLLPQAKKYRLPLPKNGQVILQEIAKKMEGFTGRDIRNYVDALLNKILMKGGKHISRALLEEKLEELQQDERSLSPAA